MSDHDLPEQVLEAGRERLSTFRPDRTPPFAALQARKRRRDMRRAGTLLGSTAIAVAAVAVVPAALTSGPAPGSPGLASQLGLSPCERLLDDERLAGMRLVEAMSAGGPQDGVLCLYAPAGARTADATPASPVQGLRAVVRPDGRTTVTAYTFTARPVDPGDTGPTAPATTAGQEPTEVGVAPYRLSADGLTLTLTGNAGGGCSGRGTVTATAEESAERVVVHALVARPSLPPRPPGTACTTEMAIQQVQLRLQEPLGDRPVVDGSTGEQISGQQDGGPSRVPAVLTPAQQAFVDSCVGPENAPLEPQYVGMSEAEANPPNSYRPYPTRVVGRDGKCLGRTKDLQGNRVNLIVEDGKVIWAGRF